MTIERVCGRPVGAVAAVLKPASWKPAGLRGAAVDEVTRADFEDALDDSRATVTEEMEAEYERMKGELKKRAMEVSPIGFIAPGMVAPTRERKHGD